MSPGSLEFPAGPRPGRNVLHRLARTLGERGLTLVTAESCTGGLIAARLTDIPGASDWFEGAFVTYRLRAKRDFIGVPGALLERHGAVSEPVARAMAEGALAHSAADVAVAVTGVAGPGGGELATPVGTVWFGWALRGAGRVETARQSFTGNRRTVRAHVVAWAAWGMLQMLGDA